MVSLYIIQQLMCVIILFRLKTIYSILSLSLTFIIFNFKPDTYDIISYTKNGGENWTNISNILVDFNDVYILDKYHAIAVGNHGMIYYTIDGYQTWNELSIEQINGMGNGNNIINQNTNITSVKMISNDTFILSCVTQSFNPIRKQTGSTNMFYLHFPDLFNLSNRTSLLDIYGNMAILGDINVSNSGKIQTTNNTFYLLNMNSL
jgi:hypothetical protein